MFLPKEVQFFDFFEELSSKITEGAKIYYEFLEEFENPKAKAARIKEIEHEADHITHKTFEKLHKSFITPLDREDIHAIIKKMDNILDLIDAAAQRMYIYKVPKPGKNFISLVKCLYKTTEELERIVHHLRNMKKSDVIIEGCIKINTLENEGDQILRASVGELFETEEDIKLLIKWKELFEIIEFAIDECEDVANIIEGIVIKYG